VLFLLFCFLFICGIAYYLINDAKSSAAMVTTSPQAVVDVKKLFDEEELKTELTAFFKEVYSCFSTGTLNTISPQINPEIVKSLQDSIKARDEAKFSHSFSSEPICIIKDISLGNDNIVCIKTEFKSEQRISVENMEDITDNVVDMFVFEKRLHQKNAPWKLVRMG
jgi:predicted lipid-binding transport protein (Tim44 family)